MRSFLAGLTILLFASAAFAQARGEVESIGFGDGYYRPECWTPMVVRLESQISEPAEYRIEVHQHDLDFDRVIYVKDGITLNGNATQRWELCFLPEPIHNGLPDGSVAQLQDRLHVYLTNKDGTRQIAQLPITSAVQSLDATEGYGNVVGRKLVLFVTDGGSRPSFSDYATAVGLVERPVPVMLRPSGLPQSVLAYQSVDAVVWLSGDAHVLSEQGSSQLTALRQWISQGGSLVVCQPGSDGDRPLLEPLADLLPILWKDEGRWDVGAAQKTDLEPLTTLARFRTASADRNKFWKLKGPFTFARATAKPQAVVDAWIQWDDKGKDQTPYIARIPYGVGSVTWVAQDLGDPRITGTGTAGWPYVWDAVFGWKNTTRVAGDKTEKDVKSFEIFPNSPVVDLATPQRGGVEFGAKGAGLISLAVIFFIVYWIAAGPGSYLFLAGRKRKEWSWTAFGMIALGATVLTVLVVRLVLRGKPEIHHATAVRLVGGPGERPAVAYSDIGLYIPRDGSQRVALAGAGGQCVSYLSPLPVPPSDGSNDFPANRDYQVPVNDSPSDHDPVLDVPFRSTLKKLAAKWCGQVPGGIRGNDLKLNPGGGTKHPIDGTLDNLSGVDLRHVYVAFRATGEDVVLYVPEWPAAAGSNRIDLAKVFTEAEPLPLLGNENLAPFPDGRSTARGEIGRQWSYYWNKNPDQRGAAVGWIPMLSFFNRIPPARNDEGQGTRSTILLRRGARQLDMSNALTAGALVVLAESENQPLPFPVEVNGETIRGRGEVLYQVALPLDHADAFAPPASGGR